MRKWANAVLAGEETSELIPVEAPETISNATDLNSRLDTIQKWLDTEANEEPGPSQTT